MTRRDEPVRHPDDRAETDHDGPWVALLAAAVVGWSALVALDRTLAGGTLLWATVRSLHSLILAPVAAAALYQDPRTLDDRGIDFGRARYGYALAALVAPPTAVWYLCHRRLRR